MPLQERIAAVAEDVRTRKDVFRKIPTEDLARVLDVPLDALDGCSDRWDEWIAYFYVKKRSLQKYVADYENPEEMIEGIEAEVSPERFQTLRDKCKILKTAGILRFLTAQERQLLTTVCAMNELHYKLEGGECDAVEYYYVDQGSADELEFEATFFEPLQRLESAEIRGPYDKRDGKFDVLKNCVGKLLNDASFFEIDAAGEWTDLDHKESDDD